MMWIEWLIVQNSGSLLQDYQITKELLDYEDTAQLSHHLTFSDLTQSTIYKFIQFLWEIRKGGMDLSVSCIPDWLQQNTNYIHKELF